MAFSRIRCFESIGYIESSAPQRPQAATVFAAYRDGMTREGYEVATFTVPTTGTYQSTRSGARYHYKAGEVIDLLTAVDLSMPGAVAPAAEGPFNAAQQAELDDLQTQVDDLDAAYKTSIGFTPVAVTATANGQTTGVVPAESGFAIVTSANAAHIVTLPAPHVGQVVRLRNAGTGYELRSSDPETIKINGGSGVDAESAIGANVYVECLNDTATSWLCRQYATDGTQAATEVAAP